MAVDYRNALSALDRAYSDLTGFGAGLSRYDLLAGTRCHGWVVADVLYHLVCDAQRALVALASPVPGPPDRDLVTYWSGFGEPEEPILGAWWTRRSAAAFRDGTGIVRLWAETAPAVVRAAGRADPDGHLATQGYVLPVPDLLATLVTEAVIHHLDMVVDLPSVPGPAPGPMDLTASTLDGLGGGTRPAWSLAEYLLKGSGRILLSPADRAALGESAAGRYPLLG